MRLILLSAAVALTATAAWAQSEPVARETIEEAVEEVLQGYPLERPMGKPGDSDLDFATSFPGRDSVFPSLMSEAIPEFKRDLYEKYHLKLALSYQAIMMAPSDVLFGENYAAAGFFLIEAKWDFLNPGEDYQGGIVFAVMDVHPYGSAAAPALTFAQIGSMIPADAFYVDIPWAVTDLFWEQWLKKDLFVFRIGNLNAMNVLDFFRYADFRTSFSLNGLGFPVTSIPFGPPGLGLAVKWWDEKRGGLYVTGAVNDINSEIDGLDWSAPFEAGDLFAGIEVGHNWMRMTETGGELDHVHLLVFYADEPTRKAFPSESGWGFKIAGEKQWGQWVAFANYTYNTAKGGGFGFTYNEHNVNVGVAYNKPLGIRGEAALALVWAKQLDGGNCGLLDCQGRDQWATELYWKILLAPDLWITPGIQFHFNPVNNPTEDLVVVPLLKLRLFF